jgi:flagellar biogenesis protein FliO
MGLKPRRGALVKHALSVAAVTIALTSHGVAWSAESALELPSFGGLLLQALVLLLVVSILAYIAIRFGLSRWFKEGRDVEGHLDLVASLPLGGRRTVYLVRALDRILVVGASEAGLTRLADLGPGSLEALAGPEGAAPEDKRPTPGGEADL